MTSKEEKIFKEIQQRNGKKGGENTLKKHGVDHYKKMSAARWQKKDQVN